MAAVTAKIQATVSGATVTLAELSFADLTSLLVTTFGSINDSISLPLTRPVKIDAGTAVNLVVANAFTFGAASACVHYFTHGRGSNTGN